MAYSWTYRQNKPDAFALLNKTTPKHRLVRFKGELLKAVLYNSNLLLNNDGFPKHRTVNNNASQTRQQQSRAFRLRWKM